MSKKFEISLDEYEIANLQWCLSTIYFGTAEQKPHLNTGDWVGQILWKLEQLMIDNKITHKPNQELTRPLQGYYSGMTTEEHNKIAGFTAQETGIDQRDIVIAALICVLGKDTQFVRKYLPIAAEVIKQAKDTMSSSIERLDRWAEEIKATKTDADKNKSCG